MSPFSSVRCITALLSFCFCVTVRAGPAGVLDPTFDGDGKQTLAFDLGPVEIEQANDDNAAIAVSAPGGRFYLVGGAATGQATSAIGLARMRYDGALDLAFGDQGTRVHDLMPGGQSVVQDAALQSDGKLLVAGWVNDGIDMYKRPMLCRFGTDGLRDIGFGDKTSPGCRFFLGIPGDFGALLVQGDGRLVAGGGRSIDGVGHGHVIRLKPDGSNDETFGDAGAVMLGDAYGQSTIFGLAQTIEGHVLATGLADPPDDNAQGANDTLVMRLDGQSGAPDPSFGPNGIRVIGVGTGAAVNRRNDVGFDVHALSDGSVLVIGSTATDYGPELSASFSSRPFAMKLLENGELDPEFGGGIRVYNPCPIFIFDCDVDAGVGRASFVFEDGRFVIAGTYRYPNETSDVFAMRLLPDGGLDLGFGPQMIGQEATALVDFGLVAPEQSLDGASSGFADGERIVLAGYAATPPAGNATVADLDFAVARLDHGLDQTFVVTSESVGNGTSTPTLQNAKHSDHVDIELTPAPGYRVGKVEGCGGALYGTVYTTGAIVADCTVTASFEPEPAELFADSFEP